MKHADAVELLAAHALGAVHGNEREALDQHLRACARCRAELTEQREVVDLLAFGDEDEPSVEVWERIAAKIRPPPPERLTIASRRARRAYIGRLMIGALATAAAVAIGVLGVQVNDANDRIDQLQAGPLDPMAQLFKSAASKPEAVHVTLESQSHAVRVPVVISDDSHAYLDAADLPRLAVDRTYQLWGAIDHRLVSLGVLGADPRFVAFNPRLFSAFAITQEQAGGVVQSTATPVVAGAVPGS